jgi:hypothetical protein
MNKAILFKFVVVVFFFCGVESMYGQVLWQKAESGMTVAQIKTIYPNASSIVNKSQTDGTEELLRINNLKIVNNSFYASFIFRTDRLVRVVLSPHDEVNQFQASSLFKSLQRALIEKYGSVFLYDADLITTNERVLFSYRLIWIVGDTEIQLGSLNASGSYSSIQISYGGTAVDIDTNNL